MMRLAKNIEKMGDRWRRSKDDVDRVETDLLPRNVGVAREFLGGSGYARPLLGADGAVGSAIIVGLAGFHFDENQLVAVPANEVDLTGTRGHATVAGDDDDAVALQVTVGNILAAAAEGMVGREVAMPGMVAQHVGEL